MKTLELPLAIPFDTWPLKREHILLLYKHLRPDDLHFAEGGEETLVRRLQAMLVMTRRSVLDLIRTA